MHLKTHTAYPEIFVNGDFSWNAKILNSEGKVKEEFKGKALTRKEAIKAATAEIGIVQDNYLKPVERETETITSDDIGILDITNSGGDS